MFIDIDPNVNEETWEERAARHRKEFLDATLRVIDACTSCCIELPDVEMAREFWTRFPIYNNMDRDGILRLIDTIDRTMPRMQFGEGNPNNGNHAMRISVGNEGSAVMYVRLNKFYTKGRESEVKRAWAAIQSAAQHAGADEIDDYSNSFPYDGEWIFRIWFD